MKLNVRKVLNEVKSNKGKRNKHGSSSTKLINKWTSDIS